MSFDFRTYQKYIAIYHSYSLHLICTLLFTNPNINSFLAWNPCKYSLPNEVNNFNYFFNKELNQML